MTKSELLAQLRLLTGDLTKGEAGPDELHSLRRRLAASLNDAAPQAVQQVAPISAGESLEPRLQLAIAESAQEQVPETSTLTLVRRQTPLASPLLAGGPATQFQGQSPARVFGPFADALQRPVWFDEFLVGPVLKIAWAGQPRVAIVLPSAVVLPGATKLQFGACSVWIASAMLAPTGLDGTFSGWKVTQATVELSSPGTVGGDTLTLPGGATVHLRIAPDNSELAAVPAGPGIDSAGTSINRPAEADLTFKGGKLVSIGAGAAALQTLGIRGGLQRNQAQPEYDSFLQRVCIPFAADLAEFAIPGSQSSLCGVSGQGKLVQAAWAPALSKAAPEQLGDAGSGGALVLVADGAFTASCAGVERGPVRFGTIYILADRGTLGILAAITSNLTADYPLALWGSSELRLAFDRPLPFVFLSSRTATEVVEFQGTLTASLDQPLQADGSKLRLRFARAPLLLFQTAAGISTFGSVASSVAGSRTALALSNGLFTVTPAQGIEWNGQLPDPSSVASGAVSITFGVYQLLPALPDPYAASFDSDFRADAPRGQLLLNITWANGEPQLGFSVTSGTDAQGSPEILPAPQSNPLSGQAEALLNRYYDDLSGQRRVAAQSRDLRLLDLSSNSDQLGVNLSYWPGAAGTIQVSGVDLVSLAAPVEVMMLPQVQWEPVYVEQNPRVGVLPQELDSPDDGGATLVGARTVKLVPIAPLPVAAAVVNAHNRDAQFTSALFTLPFGIRALATFDPAASLVARRAAIELRQQSFKDSFTSAAQIRLTAAAQPPAILRDAGGQFIVVPQPPLLPGFAVQLAEATDQAGTHIRYYETFPAPPPPFPQLPPVLVDGGPPPYSVLNPLDTDFNNTFGLGGQELGVPIERVDLSGYGASCFSNWVSSEDIGITNVTFEVLNGRTKYEVLRMRSRLAPCDAVVVRTIILERRASGNVYRRDSGWKAVTDGLFEWKDTHIRCHTGAVRGFYNIREIRDMPGTIAVGGAEVEVVNFDTDIELDHVTAGASSANRVTSRGQLGFVQRVPLSVGVETGVDPLNAVQLSELLKKYDAGGALDCTIDIGGSGQAMRVHSVFCEPASAPGAGIPEFAVASYGSPAVPGNQSWSFVRVNNVAGTVSAVDANRGVPLIRQGTSVTPPSGPYRIADPQDLLNTSPASDYGLQLTTSTHRLLFRRPEITPGNPAITGALSPLLADPYSLIGSAGPFPNPGSCLQLQPASYRLDILAGGYRWATPGAMSFDIPDLGPLLQRFLVRSSAFDLRVDYKGLAVMVKADSGAWSINLPQVPTVLNVSTPDLGSDILTVYNDVATTGTDAALLLPPVVEFGEALATASDIITALQAFRPSVPPITVDLSAPSLSDPALRLLMAARFPIAADDGSPIEIGIGKFRGEIDVGAQVQLTVAGFGGRLFFTVMGELQQALLPELLYVGGSLSIEVAIDESGTPGVKLVTSAVGSVGGDLIPDLIELEGTVSYGWFLDTTESPFVPGVALGMEVRARLVEGFLGVRMRADVSVGAAIDPPDGALLKRNLFIQGEFTGMISVVAAWVFEQDFSKTLRFQQEIPGVVVAALAVYTGLVPIVV